MTGTAVTVAPQPAPITEAPAGNLPAVVDGGREVAPTWEPGRFDPVRNEAHKTGAYNWMAREWGRESADALLHRWGDDFGRNLQQAAQFVGAYPELNEIAARHGLADHPALLEMAHALNRYRQAGRPVSAAPAPSYAPQQPTGGRTVEDLTAAIEASRERQQQLQHKGRNSEASAEYQREMALIAERDGSREIINGRRTA